MLKKPKEKGRRAELRIAEIIRGFGFKAQRTPLSGAIDSWKGDITTNLPFFFEVKCQETWKPLEYYRKADLESGAKVPIIIMTKNREDDYAFLLFTDLMRLITDKTIIKEKIKKPEKKQKLSLQETSNLRFSKLHQVRKKSKT